jgi:DNA-binding transcriptional ArsR family regulator
MPLQYERPSASRGLLFDSSIRSQLKLTYRLTIMNVPYDSPQLDSILDALANQKRRGIIHDLSLQPHAVGQLARNHELSLPAIHKHIRVLEEAKLIIRRKSGRTNYVALDNTTLGLAQNWITQYHVAWGNPQATLKNYLSRMKE